MPAKRKDENNEDAESVNSSNGSVSARNSTKRSTKQTAKASNISLVEAAIKPVTYIMNIFFFFQSLSIRLFFCLD
jgi:hypothetical protein